MSVRWSSAATSSSAFVPGIPNGTPAAARRARMNSRCGRGSGVAASAGFLGGGAAPYGVGIPYARQTAR